MLGLEVGYGAGRGELSRLGCATGPEAGKDTGGAHQLVLVHKM